MKARYTKKDLRRFDVITSLRNIGLTQHPDYPPFHFATQSMTPDKYTAVYGIIGHKQIQVMPSMFDADLLIVAIPFI